LVASEIGAFFSLAGGGVAPMAPDAEMATIQLCEKDPTDLIDLVST
jgi:hypothetical protein